MPVMLDDVRDLQNATAQQAAKDYAKKVEESADANNRNVGGAMDKDQFLMLLCAQLRYQNPLEPSNDSEFATQLAQFTSLEQLQNMNTSMTTMTDYQSYSLVGKFVMAESYVNGELESIAGVVDSIFTDAKGVTRAQIGEYDVPVSSIKEVFDTNNILTTEMFMQTSAQLIGREVIAVNGDEEIEGIVTRILVDKGSMYAQIDDGTDEPKFVSVNTIVDIREAGTSASKLKPKFPPEAVNFKNDPDSDGYIEYDDDLETPIGRWDWDNGQWKWVYTPFTEDEATEELDDAA